MHSLLIKVKKIFAKYAQVLFVLIAFALMVISSYLFLNSTERRHMRESAENVILFTEANIKTDMLEPGTLLMVISETINNMLVSGAGSSDVNNYLISVNSYVSSSSEERLTGVTGFFGVFDIFSGIMLLGEETWDLPEDYNLENRPWYSGAVRASGGLSISEPYLNQFSNEITITLSRRIFDNNGSPLGIICANVELDRIMQYVVNTRFATAGYGFLLSEDFMVIAHPDSSLVGLPYNNTRSGLPLILDQARLTGSISEAMVIDYMGIWSIVFVERLYNGWYMGVVTPRDRYFQGSRNLMILLASLGAVFAGLLIWILMRIFADKASSDARMQLMFNSTPMCACFWDKKFNVIDCNNNMLNIFELSGVHEFRDRFFELMPEYQPDGRLSKKKAQECFNKSLAESFFRFEWMHQKLNGEPIPCEVTLVRTKFRNDFIVIGYIRDLREQKKINAALERHARLLDTVNTAAAILLASNDMEGFESSLLNCFDLIGHCLDIDRVQIWRNEIIEEEPHFVLRYEWLSEYGKTCRSIPIGLHFPYSMKKTWAEKFLQHEFINSPLSKLSEEDQAFLGYYDMKSIVIIPMFLEGDFWGFFSIDDCLNERTFSDEEIKIMASAGLMMSSAVNRNNQILKTREAEERTQIMFDAAPLCAIFWDKNLNLVDCNQETLKTFGFSSKNEFMETFFNLSPEYQPDGVLSKEKGPRLVKKALDEGYSRFEWMHQKINGEPIPADVICIRVRHKDEFTVTEYIRDLREQKAMIAEMRKAEIAEESSKAKSDFLARMSHEIRTPMNAILGISEIQLQDESHPQITKEAFERIYNSGDMLLGIINDILDLSKIEAGKLILLPAQYDITSLIHDTVQLNLMRYESKPIEFVLDVKEDLPLILIGDELRIKQILNNLLSNAFKYTNEGMVNLSIYAEPASADDSTKKMLIFVISDTGQGMTADQIRKLGTEYSRFNMDANRQTEGTGLGMNITRNLIHLMNGNMSIESTPGLGSTFTVRLPQDCVGSSVLGRELADNLMMLNPDSLFKNRAFQMKRDFMPYGRVLVVDDVETNLYVARGLLAPYGLSVETVMSGFEAVDKIRDGFSYDIIFMDHMMPRMDGIEAAKIIRSLGYSKPIVALTANALTGQAEIFLKSGFDDFISKPIDIRQLNMSLNSFIRDKYPLDVVEAAKKQKDRIYLGSGNKKPVDSQLAEFFVKDAKKAISLLETIYVNKCRRADDISAFIINIHAMKSALSNIGETELSAEASKLEQAGREQNNKLILSELPVFIEMLNTVVEKLNPAEETQAEETMYDMSYLKERFLDIKEACVIYDKKAARKAMEDIKNKTWPLSVKEQISAIAGHLLHSDFEETIKVIDNSLNSLFK